MSDFYDFDVIPAILDNFKIKHVIISGVKDENLINQILNYDADYTLINTPMVKNLAVINENPLEALPILSYDAIFIDDDSNWYTIFTQLNIIKDTNEEFPLIFICNNRFPNKRRDSYSNPDLIPEKFRNEYAEELPLFYNNEKITISDGFYHACEENTPQNGVLTGIEDFLAENSNIEIMGINFIEDITILYDNSSINKERTENIIKSINGVELNDLDLSNKLIENKLLVSYINKYNVSNDILNDYELEISNKDNLIREYEDRIRTQDKEIHYRDSKIDSFESKLNLKDTQIRSFESKLDNKDRVIEQQMNKLEIINKQNTFQLSKRDRDKYCISCFKEEISNKHTEIDYLKKNTLTRKILSPLGYLYLILKSNPKEIPINFRLFKALKNSKCFDIGFYLNNNHDLQKSKWCKYFSPELHYVCNGFNEDRTFNKKYFDRNSKKDLLNYLLKCDK